MIIAFCPPFAVAPPAEPARSAVDATSPATDGVRSVAPVHRHRPVARAHVLGGSAGPGRMRVAGNARSALIGVDRSGRPSGDRVPRMASMDLRFITPTAVEDHPVEEAAALLERDDGYLWLDVPRWGDDAARVLT